MFGITAGDVVIAVHADAMGLGFANLTRILRVTHFNFFLVEKLNNHHFCFYLRCQAHLKSQLLN